MASTRIATSLLPRTFSRATPTITRVLPATFRTQTLQQHQNCPPQAVRNVQRRWNSGSPQENGSESKIYKYKDVVKLISEREKGSEKVKDIVLIDAREPHELVETGRIPYAVNVPVASQADAWFIADEEFEDRFGFPRPSKGEEVVFYCKSGVRSGTAAQLATMGGWTRVGEYKGSWLDWEKNKGKIERET